MKKNGLTTAVIAGIAGVAGIGSIADAVNLNPDGLGQVLIYPYYTSQGGNDTLLSVVNTSNIAKAVKVRFLEGRNSREVLDFHLYLSPFDVWTAAVFQIPEGTSGFPAAGVLSRDNSCTVPQLGSSDLGGTFAGAPYEPFVNYAYADLDHAPNAAALLGSLERTREGYLEIIEMANVVTAPGTTWITHVNGVPGNCAAAVAAWSAGGIWSTTNGAAYTAAPSGAGQLFGNAMIVNPAMGTISGYPADAIEGFNYTNLHNFPGDTRPGLESVNDPGPVVTQATANVFDFGQLVSATYDNVPLYGQVDALSALYASPSVINEYYLDSNDQVRSDSEWVILFPTKRYYVDDWPYIAADGFGGFVEVESFNPEAPREPFTNPFRTGGSCETIRIRIFDREERAPGGGGLPFSPPRPGSPANALCWEAQVVTFGQGENVTEGNPSSILGSTYFNNITPPTGFDAGWASIDFGRAISGSFTAPTMRPSAEGFIFSGLPVTGFFVTRYDNGVSDAGVLANYSALFRHRTERECNVLVPGNPDGAISCS